MSTQTENKGLLSHVKSRAFSKTGLIAGGSLVFVLLLGAGGGYVWAGQYEGRIGPNVFIADIDISGMDENSARQLVQTRVESIISTGLPLSVDGEAKTLPLSTFVSDAVLDDVTIDIDTAIAQALAASHGENAFENTFVLAKQYLGRTEIYPMVTVDEAAVMASLRRLYPDAETFAQNAGFSISGKTDSWSVEVTDAVDGQEFNQTTFIKDITFPLIHLSESLELPISVEATSVQAPVQRKDAETFIEDVNALLIRAPFTLTHEEPGRTRTWSLSGAQIAEMIALDRNDTGVFLTLQGEAFEDYLDDISDDVYIQPRNAKFEITDGHVTEFVGSIPGQELDREGTTHAVEQMFTDEDQNEVSIVVLQTAPEIATGDVNDLGVSELLGVGISDYSNSPANRISNIRNAVRILNGTLIAPDETFSLVKALSPFSYENGFLPELVIKGDKIEPEMGGGACQIGTTTFRATMNSGLEIVERRNHSLVVNHYNDPTNGNPGTDATIYEQSPGVGAPDYKFRNDTGHYILFQAEMLTDTQELRFSFWGTSDGRKGSYTPPVVLRWIGAGAKQEIETTDLEPGTRKCQNSFTGADAMFTYTIERADGTKEDRVFESHYRPLPSICLVGVDPLSETGELSEDVSPETSETPTEEQIPLQETDPASELPQTEDTSA